MSEKPAISELLKQAASLLPESAANVRAEFEKNLRPIVEASFAKLDLVTRMEFDAQLELLGRLEQRTADLEAELAALKGDSRAADNASE